MPAPADGFLLRRRQPPHAAVLRRLRRRLASPSVRGRGCFSPHWYRGRGPCRRPDTSTCAPTAAWGRRRRVLRPGPARFAPCRHAIVVHHPRAVERPCERCALRAVRVEAIAVAKRHGSIVIRDVCPVAPPRPADPVVNDGACAGQPLWSRGHHAPMHHRPGTAGPVPRRPRTRAVRCRSTRGLPCRAAT